MTALKKYNRLECEGLWRAPDDDQLPDQNNQRRDVIVSLGQATLVLRDKNDVALAHWSLAAIHRENPKERPAIYSPSKDSSEFLELQEDMMIDAIEKISKSIERARPKPGRVRYAIFGAITLFIAAMAFFWLPDALINQTISVVPKSKRIAIGNAVLEYIGQSSNAPCNGSQGLLALSKISTRLASGENTAIYILPDLPFEANHLPGDIILINQGLLEKYDDPGVISGFILAEQLRAKNTDPIEHLLRDVGLVSTFRLLTTGYIAPDSLKTYAGHFMKKPPEEVSQTALLAVFQSARIRVTPYAYAIDSTGESTLNLIESDPFSTLPADPILKDGDWVSLQGICE